MFLFNKLFKRPRCFKCNVNRRMTKLPDGKITQCAIDTQTVGALLCVQIFSVGGLSRGGEERWGIWRNTKRKYVIGNNSILPSCDIKYGTKLQSNATWKDTGQRRWLVGTRPDPTGWLQQARRVGGTVCTETPYIGLLAEHIECPRWYKCRVIGIALLLINIRGVTRKLWRGRMPSINLIHINTM